MGLGLINSFVISLSGFVWSTNHGSLCDVVMTEMSFPAFPFQALFGPLIMTRDVMRS